MKRWLAKPRARRLARVLLAAAGLTGTGLGPAPAQWLGPLPEAPIPPGAIVRSLMNRGFAEIGRPGLSGEVYVVDGINSRGMRLRLVIDAYDGSLVSRTRLDAPMLPPAEVGRGRIARAELFGEYHGPSFDDEAIAPRRWQGPPVDRDSLPPPPGARRAERIEPPFAEPPLVEPRRPGRPPAAKPAEPGRSERAAPQRQARKPDSAPAKPKQADPATVPPAPAAPVEAAKPEAPKTPAASAPAPAWKEPPAEPDKPDAGQRSVRVIGGVTPMGRQGQPREPDLPAPEVPPPVTID